MRKSTTGNSLILCKFGAMCTKGAACSFSHATPKPFHNAPGLIPCKFGAMCTKGDVCPFLHESSASKPHNNPFTTLNAKQLRFFFYLSFISYFSSISHTLIYNLLSLFLSLSLLIFFSLNIPLIRSPSFIPVNRLSPT